MVKNLQKRTQKSLAEKGALTCPQKPLSLCDTN